ncbi:uncharacterized protein LOC133901433 [Phragmites australis]|uniref:uncharacterized protein LOC133901433 n=1 Tax=Phragmites australis TaxID=29695 RepID=UPI002D7995FC|nr:uncharacterized protein LOC133901433 [Phragmites australis]
MELTIGSKMVPMVFFIVNVQGISAFVALVDASVDWQHINVQCLSGQDLSSYDSVVLLGMVTVVFSEPKALLRYCGEEVMQTLDPKTGNPAPCGICLDGLASSSRTAPVNFPCSHAFHSQCITKWLFKGTACPLCRHDLRGLVASPGTRPWEGLGGTPGTRP